MKSGDLFSQNSISSQLIRIVFGFYCLFAIVITAIQVFIEYQHTENIIKTELKINEDIFASSLSAGVWNLDIEQIQVTVNGMLSVPIISGVVIEQDNKILAARGLIETKEGAIYTYDNQGELQADNALKNNNLFSYSFPITYLYKGKGIPIGNASIYSNNTVVFDRIEMGITLIIVNAFIKSFILWLLFIWISRSILITPLNQLITAIKNVNLENIGNFQLNLKNKRKNELTIIEQSFMSMVKQLKEARESVLNSQRVLVEKVKQRTAELELSTQKAEVANIAKSNFMSRVSHELNTPLNAIIGCSHLLTTNIASAKLENNSQNEELIKNIRISGEHLNMLVQDIFELTQNNREKLNIAEERVDLNDVVLSAINMLSTLAAERNVTLIYQPSPLTVFANTLRLRQVLLNLLDNAIKYNQVNGSVEIKLQENDMGQIKLSIDDTGVGIPNEDLDTIFEPLSRLAYAEEQCIDGMGLGLSIVKMLVDRMDIMIQVKSTVNNGSSFILYFSKLP